MITQLHAEILILAILLVLQTVIPGQHRRTSFREIMTRIMEVAGERLVSQMSELFDGDIFAASAETAALRKDVHWTAAKPPPAVFTAKILKYYVRNFRHFELFLQQTFVCLFSRLGFNKI